MNKRCIVGTVVSVDLWGDVSGGEGAIPVNDFIGGILGQIAHAGYDPAKCVINRIYYDGEYLLGIFATREETEDEMNVMLVKENRAKMTKLEKQRLKVERELKKLRKMEKQ